MTDQAKKTLGLFNEKVERLDRLSFTRWVREKRVGFTANVNGETSSFELRAPDEESTDAFMLTLRFFVQNNESISIGRIVILYESLALPEELSRPYLGARARLNEYLDGPSMIITKSGQLSHRHILLTFLYGQFAHASPDKKEEFDRWREDDMIFGMIQGLFYIIVVDVLQFLLWSRNLHVRTLQFLESGAGAV